MNNKTKHKKRCYFRRELFIKEISLLKERGKAQEDLAIHAKVNPSTVVKHKNGDRLPDETTLRKYEEELGLPQGILTSYSKEYLKKFFYFL